MPRVPTRKAWRGRAERGHSARATALRRATQPLATRANRWLGHGPTPVTRLRFETKGSATLPFPQARAAHPARDRLRTGTRARRAAVRGRRPRAQPQGEAGGRRPTASSICATATGGRPRSCPRWRSVRPSPSCKLTAIGRAGRVPCRCAARTAGRSAGCRRPEAPTAGWSRRSAPTAAAPSPIPGGVDSEGIAVARTALLDRRRIWPVAAAGRADGRSSGCRIPRGTVPKARLTGRGRAAGARRQAPRQPRLRSDRPVRRRRRLASISAALASTSRTMWSTMPSSCTWWSVTPDR
jgi:hypothetical protein